jgi:hypothetical protein
VVCIFQCLGRLGLVSFEEEKINEIEKKKVVAVWMAVIQ